MSHSKRNTTRAFFTAHERNELKGQWGSTATRLTRESFLPFGSCNLCLIQAEDPVACASQGHLFCRECAVSNLLAQTKEIKRLQKEAKRRDAEVEEHQQQELAAEQHRELASFEKTQAGKRSREDDTSHASKRQRQSFWIPSQTAEAKPEPLKVKLRPVCPVSDKPHDLALKSLVDVKFTGSARSCPSCDKSLSNSTKGVLAKACGHVLCKACSDRFQGLADGPIACFVCQKSIDTDGPDIVGLITIKSDATGFAGSGGNKVKKAGLAFQFG